ncbi:MAG: hydrogenase maturation protease [Acidobacteria bacterium]|nr:hydrogenase maturation protease [Acidobacteriota bacterium]
MNCEHSTTTILILGIGNILMGDEGVGVRAVEFLQDSELPDDVQTLDGGTGSFLLLEPMQQAQTIILIDATFDENPPGTIRRLTPHFSKDYPRTLTAHDIGLKDLLDAFYLLGNVPEVILYAVSIAPWQEMEMKLSPTIAATLPSLAQRILAEIAALKAQPVDTSTPATA